MSYDISLYNSGATHSFSSTRRLPLRAPSDLGSWQDSGSVKKDATQLLPSFRVR